MIMVCRMFGKKLYNEAQIAEALCKYAHEAAKKLRANGLVAKQMSIFIQTNGTNGARGCGYSTRYQFPSATDSTIDFSNRQSRHLGQQFTRCKFKLLTRFTQRFFKFYISQSRYCSLTTLSATSSLTMQLSFLNFSYNSTVSLTAFFTTCLCVLF